MIIHKATDGSIAIMILAEGISDEQKVEAIQTFKDTHDGNYEEHVEGDFKLPDNREFRNAWRLNGKNVVIDNDVAMQIHLKRIRAARNVALQKLDIEQLRHISVPGMALEIDKQKQILRDLPVNINNLDWPDNLAN